MMLCSKNLQRSRDIFLLALVFFISIGCNDKKYTTSRVQKSAVTTTTFVDLRDGRSYPVVKIGTQTWLAKNLNFALDSSWTSNSQADSAVEYGRLYQWAVAMKLDDSCKRKSCSDQINHPHQGVCPIGWHVPSDAEWGILENSVNSNKDEKKTIGSTLNDYGFETVPVGIGSIGFWSTSETKYDAKLAFRQEFIQTYHPTSHRGSIFKPKRKNESPAPDVWGVTSAKVDRFLIRCLQN